MKTIKLAAFGFLFVAGSCAITPTERLDIVSATEVPEPSLEKIADGVWIHKSYKDIEPWGPILSQGLVVETDAGVILVDTAWNDEDTNEILQLVKSQTGQTPISAIVTHAHEDKMGGMGALHERDIATQAYVDTYNDASKRDLTPPRSWFDGPFVSRAVQVSGGADNEEIMDLDELSTFVPGAGHTRDNIVVYHSPSKTLFGGCLIRPGGSRSLGNTADADIQNWANAVRKVAEAFPDAEIVIPSHGAPGGRELLDHTIALAEAAAAKLNAE